MTIETFIQEENLIRPGDRICVALSGGPDSMALLHCLMNLGETWQVKLSAVHIHHGLRSASNDEEAFVRAWCQAHQIPLEVVAVDLKDADYKGMSTEEAARVARYRVFAGIIEREACKVALGHHMDDQAETVLLNLLRGAGVQGLRGMLPRRDNYIRPMLSTSRTDILAYCREREIPYVTDSSNLTTDFTRNYLRHEIMPRLANEVQPKVTERLATTARILRDEEDWMSEMTEQAFGQVATMSDGKIILDRQIFTDCPGALQRRLLRMGLEALAGQLRDVTYDHIRTGCQLLAKGETGKEIHLPEGLKLRLDYGQGVLEKVPELSGEKPRETILAIKDLQVGDAVEIQGFRLAKIMPQNPQEYPKNKYTKWFDYDKIRTDLILRTRRPGDWLAIGPQGHRKKLKDFFIDSKVSRPERERIWLLTMGSQVLWVVGHRTNDNYRIDETTGVVLEVSFLKEEQQ